MIVAAMGDSVTSGVGDVDGDQRGWAAHLAYALGASRFHNLARAGARTADVVGEQLPRALEVRPFISTIQVGGNDVLRQGFDPEKVGQVIAQCTNALPGIRILVLLPDPRLLLRRPRIVAQALARRAGDLNDTVTSAVEYQSDLILIEPWKIPQMHEPRLWFVDRLHPSPFGHRFLAAHAVARLRSWGVQQRHCIVPAAGSGSWYADARWLVRKLQQPNSQSQSQTSRWPRRDNAPAAVGSRSLPHHRATPVS